MAINQNHLFEELNGVKCGIVEKNVKSARVEFLKRLLEFNRFTVVTAATPPPKTVVPAPIAAAPVQVDATMPENTIATQKIPETTDTTAAATAGTIATSSPTPETFTVGVTDITFNSINAIFGRLLHTPDGHVVTLAYWHEKEKISHDDIPYYEDMGDLVPEMK